MGASVQPQGGGTAPGQGFQFPINQLPPVQAPQQGGSQQMSSVPLPGQQQQQPQGQQFSAVPPHLQQPGQQQMQQQQGAHQQPLFVPNLSATQQQQGQQQQQVQQPTSADLTQVLQGDNIPPQLRGRTVADVLAQHTMLMNAVRQGMPQVQQPQQQQHVPQQQSLQTQQQHQQTQQQPQVTATEFFRDPMAVFRTALQGQKEETVNAVLQALAPVLQPVLHTTMQNQAQTAIQTVASEIGAQRWQQLWPSIQQYVATVPQNMWGNADTWRLAARTAAGEIALRGQQLPPQQQQQQFQPQQGFGTPAGPFPVQVVGPNGQPMPGLPQFFTEQPNGAPTSGRVQLTPLQRQVFQEFQKADPVTWHSEEVYLSWLGGVQPTRR